MTKKKNKVQTFDGMALRIEPGVYKLSTPAQSPRTRTTERIEAKTWNLGVDLWPAGEKFVVRKQTQNTGRQTVYQYYTIQRLNSDHIQIKSYETERWNELVCCLEPV